MNPQDPMLITPQLSPDAQPTQGAMPPQPGGMSSPAVPAADTMFQPIMSPPPQQAAMDMAPNGVVTPMAGPQFGGQQPIQPMTKLPNQPKKTSPKKPLLIGGILIMLLIVVTVVAVVLGGGKKQTPATTQQTDQAQGPQPAQAIDVEQANNSIGQDVTSFDNAKDFPDNMLDDSSLSL